MPKILSGSVVGQGILLAVSPILTRLYSAEDFGALAVFTALASVLGGVVSLSWERAVVIPRSDGQAVSLMALGVISTVTLSGILLLPLYLLRHRLDAIFGTVVFVDYWWLISLGAGAVGVQSSLSAWLTRLRRYSSMATRSAVQGVVQAVSSVGLGMLGAVPFGLLSGTAVGRGASVIGITSSGAFRGVRVPRRRLLVGSALKFRRFPLIATWSRAVNSIGLQLPPVLIVALYGSLQAGLFALTLRVIAAPIGIIVGAVSQYFEAAFATLVRLRSRRLVSLIRSICGRLLVIGILPTLLVLALGPSAFGLIFGSQWRDAGAFAQIMVVAYLAQFVVTPISRTLLILERQVLQLVWDSSRALLASLCVILPSFILGTDSLLAALVLLSTVQVCMYGVMLWVCLRIASDRERLWVTGSEGAADG